MDPDIEAHRHQDHGLLQESLALIGPVAGDLVASCCDQLFGENPEVRAMFPDGADHQRERLLEAITALAALYDRPDSLMPVLTALGRHHARGGVRPSQYDLVGDAFLRALERFGGMAWTAPYAAAWARAYTFVAEEAMAAAAATPPTERWATALVG